MLGRSADAGGHTNAAARSAVGRIPSGPNFSSGTVQFGASGTKVPACVRPRYSARHGWKRRRPSRRPYIPILVAALGYFVDIYDLVLFSIVRVPSLTSLGVSGRGLLDSGVLLLNMQMAGMLLGGILWGVLGDRRGRLSVLFGSIFLYSVANIANGFVDDVSTYAALRFIAGIGLAGELGAGITLVTEIMHKEVRGYGTTIVASVGILGAVVAARRRSLRLAHGLHHRRRHGPRAAAAPRRRLRVGHVRRRQDADVAAGTSSRYLPAAPERCAISASS